ncbi:MAG: alpha/beta fold hydrolase [Actinomycetota bacterium]|nr:alpha/beta fold hydrolase [Actinomycetota bacterium]
MKETDTNNELQGLGDFLGLVVDRVTTPVEGVNRALVDRSLRWTGSSGAPTRRKLDVAIASFYGAIRLAGSALGTTVGLGAAVAVGRSNPLSGSRLGSRFQAAINATWGDALEHRGNELRIEMGLRNALGSPVRVTPHDLTASFPTATARLVLLVHGLGRTESSWLDRGEQAGLWEMLATDTSITPVMIRYNSGRHVSENGADLARLLERLWRSWPVPLESISLVGHSMGGLVIRSACRVGHDADQRWVDTVDKVVTVGTPHLGAPLEKVANVVSWGLRATPESSPLADFLDARSVGIKDLRFGAIVDEDWLGSEPDALLRNTVSNLPPLDGVDHHFVAAVITSDPTHPVGALVGDLMVRPSSGTGQGRRRQIEATDVRVLGGRRHFDLLHDPDVQEQVLAWLSASKTGPS